MGIINCKTWGDNFSLFGLATLNYFFSWNYLKINSQLNILANQLMFYSCAFYPQHSWRSFRIGRDNEKASSWKLLPHRNPSSFTLADLERRWIEVNFRFRNETINMATTSISKNTNRYDHRFTLWNVRV